MEICSANNSVRHITNKVSRNIGNCISNFSSQISQYQATRPSL